MTRLQSLAVRLVDGSGLLVRILGDRTAAWIRKGRRDDLTGIPALLGVLLRMAIVGVGLWALWRLVRAVPNLRWLLTTVWCWCAYRAARPGKTTVGAPAGGGDSSLGPPVDQPDPAVEENRMPAPEAHRPSYTALHDVVARVGTPHVHIAVLAAELGTTGERVREALALHDIPVEPVRMRGRGSSTGVRGDHFPTPPRPSGIPSDGVVGAGQNANNDNNNGPVVHRTEWGQTMTDTMDTHRRHDVPRAS
ncbi:hypothetical protein [Streptomyces niveus]|uniref:hypothetical protein n=1 Tax=Streptomyces niveus TaxID=193462 RepID=UPI003445C826